MRYRKFSTIILKLIKLAFDMEKWLLWGSQVKSVLRPLNDEIFKFQPKNIIHFILLLSIVGSLCELDRGKPICYCSKYLIGNTFKSCSKRGCNGRNFVNLRFDSL